MFWKTDELWINGKFITGGELVGRIGYRISSNLAMFSDYQKSMLHLKYSLKHQSLKQSLPSLINSSLKIVSSGSTL
jgi:hypothetical protein